MTIYYNPDDPFLIEIRNWFEQNPISIEQLRKEENHQKIPFLNRFDPRYITEEEKKEWANNISKTKKGKMPASNSIKSLLDNCRNRKGTKDSVETRNKKSKSQIERHKKIKFRHTEETKRIISEKKLGSKRAPHSEETKQKMREKAKNRSPWNKGKIIGPYNNERRKNISEGVKKALLKKYELGMK